MSSPGHGYAWASVFLCFAFACTSSGAEETTWIAEITAKEDKGTAAEHITLVEYKHELGRVRLERAGTLNADPVPKVLHQAILDELIEERLLVVEAQNLNVRVSTQAVDRALLRLKVERPRDALQKRLIQTYQTEEALRRHIRNRLLRTELFNRAVVDHLKIDPQEVRAAWDAMPQEAKKRGPRVRAAQIVLRSEEDAKKVRRSLWRGEDFFKLAQSHSIAPEAKSGGHLGWFEQGIMPETFDEVCFQLKPGGVSNVVPSGQGFHIFTVLEREDGRPLSFEETKTKLENQVRDKRLRKKEAEYLRNLKSRFLITVKKEVLESIL